MNAYELHLFDKIKGILFDLLTLEDDLDSYHQTLDQLVASLKREMRLQNVTIYLYHKTSHCLIPEASTNQLVMEDPDQFILQKDEIKEGWFEEILIREYSFLLRQESSKSCMVLLSQMNDFIGGLELEFDKNEDVYSHVFFEKISAACYVFLKRTQIIKICNENRRYKQLFLVASKFHSSMNMDEVLMEMLHTLKLTFSQSTYYLLLSHDHSNRNNLPIKILQYDSNSSNMAAIQSYVTGSVQIESLSSEEKLILYVPLKGKQGVYGVLQVISPQTIIFSDEDINFITLLANAAGSALENAQLYQQSRQFIKNLQLINETSHRLNSNLRLNEVMAYMSNQIIRSFEAEEVGFILFESNMMTPFQGSTPFFLEAVANEYVQIVISKIKTEKDSLFIGDLAADYHLNDSRYHSLMAVPMVQNGALKGVSIVLHHDSYFFSFETFKLLQSLVHHSTLAFTNSLLREELEKLVITDYLTKLYSRNYLDEKIKQSMRHDSFGTFILIDIDDFKQINDIYGHQVGDDILILVAEFMKSNIREKDIAARWGGEELAIYLPKVDMEIGKHIAERIASKVQTESNPQITISCGISFWRLDYKESMDTLFRRADKALYIAKNSGKNKVVIDHSFIVST